MSRKVANWFEERGGARALAPWLDGKCVPADGLSLRYYLGGAILFLFGVQLVTGVLLSFHYVPTVERAFATVELITYGVDYGWFVRSVHHWAAQGMVALCFLHLVTTFASRAYRRPRELTWIAGCIALALVLMICFFGYLLPWNDLSYFATSAGIEIARSVPLIGSGIVNAIQGSSELTDGTLPRFFMFHTVVLPLALAVVLALHVFWVQVHGMAAPSGGAAAGDGARRTIPFFPTFMGRVLTSWLLLANVLVAVAVLSPVEVGEEANRFMSTPLDIKPEWYFLGLYQTLKLMPPSLGSASGEQLALGLVGLGALFVFLVPFIDGGADGKVRRRVVRVVGVLVLAYLVVASVWGHFDQSMLGGGR